MSVTVEEVARHLAALTGSEEDVLLIGKWIDARWKEIAASHTLQELETEGELFIPAPYETGTVAATRGSRTVTGTSTGWDGMLTGRHVRIRTSWYVIANITSATSLELATPFGEDSISGAGYHIVQRRHRLASDARKLGQFTHMRLRRPLKLSSKHGLDVAMPSRHSIGAPPVWVAQVKPDVDKVKRVEIYPYSNTSEIIHYVYWTSPPTLDFDDVLPQWLDIESFREGVMVDIYRHKMFKAMEDGQVEAAALWRNEFRAQETKWMRDHRVRLLGQEDGADDTEFILMREGAHPSSISDPQINDAYTQVWWG